MHSLEALAHSYYIYIYIIYLQNPICVANSSASAVKRINMCDSEIVNNCDKIIMLQ